MRWGRKQPLDVPDTHPNVSEVYRRRVERVAKTLNAPEDKAQASAAV